MQGLHHKPIIAPPLFRTLVSSQVIPWEKSPEQIRRANFDRFRALRYWVNSFGVNYSGVSASSLRRPRQFQQPQVRFRPQQDCPDVFSFSYRHEDLSGTYHNRGGTDRSCNEGSLLSAEVVV